MKNRFADLSRWLEENAHHLNEQFLKDKYVELHEYLEALKTGDLTDAQSEKLAGRIQNAALVLTTLLLTKNVKSGRIGKLLTALPMFASGDGGSKFLAKKLQALFAQGPKVVQTANLAKMMAVETIKSRGRK